MDKYIGKKLEGRYEIIELIGFGGMAVVFKARDVIENKFVAIKILKDEYLQNEDFKRRFRNESKAIALLSHPGIVKVSDVNFSDNIQYIVMEYIDGITLKEYIEQQGKVQWKEAVHFAVQILRALQHAHDNGIVHRDVKPQNVMLLEDGTIKVMDFGIARFARENGKTLSDKAIGSVHYISPEQAQGQNTDERTDIYASGVIMYEMLTGKVPFDGESPVSIAIKQMQIDPVHPKEINPEIPTGLEEIILRAMQKDPQLRYQTAAEMLRDIDEFKHNPSVIFEYKYFNKDGTTKYFNKLDSHSGMSAVSQPKKKSYTMNVLAGVAAACVLLAGVALYYFIKGMQSTPGDIEMPNVVGLTVEQAKEKAPDLRFNILDEQPSPDYDKGIIIEQKTNEKMPVKVNFEVGVVVSSGIEALIMPNLVNEITSSAKSKLNAMGIENIEINQKIDADVPEGRVIQTDPIASTELKKESNVVLYISLGVADEPIRVPTLVGKTEIEARSELVKIGLSLGEVVSVNSAEPKGKIIVQSVLPETRVLKGTKIDVQISTGISVDGNTVNISIPFPAGADDVDFIFDIYVNKAGVDIQVINPSKVTSLDIELILKDNLVNEIAPALSQNELLIFLPNGTFAIYNVDFATGIATATSSPDYNLIFANGYTPPAA